MQGGIIFGVRLTWLRSGGVKREVVLRLLGGTLAAAVRCG